MARRCDLTDKDAQFGNKVSHAQNKSRRRFKINAQNVTLRSEVLNQTIPLKLAVSTLRSIDHNGGLDEFLVTAKANNLSEKGQKLRRKIKKAIVANATA